MRLRVPHTTSPRTDPAWAIAARPGRRTTALVGWAAGCLGLVLAAAGGCATTGTATAPSAPSGPSVIADSRLCAGTDDDPKGERDPACAPTPTHEPVELVNHLAGCRAGLRGPAELRLGDQLLAILRPGERKTFSLPRGDIELTIIDNGRTETRALSLAGSGPVVVELGCGPESFGAGLQPLVLEGAHGRCTSTDAIKVRAGGLDLEVGPGQVQTLFLPRGSHIVKVGGVGRTIELGDAGARVPLSDCGL